MIERPRLVLLAGNMCDARLWAEVAPALAGWPIATPLLDRDSIAAMAAAVLVAHPGRLIPIGFSMGGIVALEMARQASGRITALGLIDTNASADLPERAAVRPRQQADVRAGALERVVVEELKPHYLAPARRDDRALLALLRDMALALGPDIFVRQSEALRTRADLRAVLPDLDRPVLIACGAEDRLCPPAWHRELADGAPRATLHIVPGAGHMLPLEQPAALAAALSGWLHIVEQEETCPIAS